MLKKSFVILGPEGDTESFFNDKTQQLTLPFLSQKIQLYELKYLLLFLCQTLSKFD